MHKTSAALALVAVLAVVPIDAQQNLTKQDADRFEQKLGKIVLQGKTAALKKSTQEHATPITDNELNSYFKYNGKAQVPVGVVDPTINAVGDGRVTGRAVVDLDAVRKQKQRGWLDPLNYLSGRLPVTAAGRLTTKDGSGQFQLESAEISGVTVPEVGPAGAAQLLLEDTGEPRRHRHGRSVRTAGRDPRDPGRHRHVHRDPVAPAQLPQSDASPGYAAPVPQGRWTAARRRPAARRPGHRRGPALSLSRSATRIAARSRRSPHFGRAPPRRWPAKSSAAASARRGAPASRFSRCSCATRPAPARGLLQPAIPRRCLPSASARDPVRPARTDVARAAAAESAVRNRQEPSDRTAHDGRGTSRVRRRHAAYRTDRADLREDRDADDEDAARDRAPGARRSCPTTLPDPLPADVRQRQRLVDRADARWPMSIFRRPVRRSTTLNAFRTAGAAAADFRGVLSLPARARAAPAPADAERKARSVVGHRRHPRIRQACAAVQAHRRSEEGAWPRSSRT